MASPTAQLTTSPPLPGTTAVQQINFGLTWTLWSLWLSVGGL